MAKVIHVISSSGLYGAERSLLGLIKSVTGYELNVKAGAIPESLTADISELEIGDNVKNL